MKMSSTELMRRYKAGDGKAFNALKQRHGDTIGMYAHRFIDSDEAALIVMGGCFASLEKERENITDPIPFLQQTAKKIIEFILADSPPITEHSELWLEMQREIPDSFNKMNLDEDLLQALRMNDESDD
jgi:hypothetical protein